MNKITNDIIYIGVNDHQIDLFEGQYLVPKGISYNSYLINDEKKVIMDTVDVGFAQEWLANIKEVLKREQPDYVVVQHMEPDHSASIAELVKEYPNITVVGNAKTFTMLKQFFKDIKVNQQVVSENDTLILGKHSLKFIMAPMVHWPEVMMSYEESEQILFSADAFGKFGALDVEEEWQNEARRYYIGIVGKYGVQVQNVLKKAASLAIKTICPLHGPILKDNLEKYLNAYQVWSSYQPETKGVLIAYSSIYGHTKKAVEILEKALKQNSLNDVVVRDLARSDLSEVISLAFQYDTLVLAGVTYNGGLFPHMNTFMEGLVERNYQKRKVAIIENGTWAPMLAKKVMEKLANSKEITYVEPIIKINASISEQNVQEIENLSKQLLD